MKNLLTFGIVTACSLLSLSFVSYSSSTPLEQALREKKIEIEILPTGDHMGNSINLKIRNLTNSNLNLELPAGTVFVPDNTEEQTLITTEEEMFALSRKAEKTLNLNAYCTEANDHCPSENSAFKMNFSQNAKLNGLVSFMDSLKITDKHAIQQSIWCLTDNHSLSNVWVDDEKSTKALRGYLSKATGQKDTWYNTRQDIRVNENHEIVRVPKEIKGFIEYTSTQSSELQGVVKDASGRIVVTNPNKTNVPPGKVKFEFKLRVEGWERGNYAVVYTNNGQEVINQPFTIE